MNANSILFYSIQWSMSEPAFDSKLAAVLVPDGRQTFSLPLALLGAFQRCSAPEETHNHTHLSKILRS